MPKRRTKDRDTDQVMPGTTSVEYAARRLGIGRCLAYELARTGELPGVLRLGHRFLVSVQALEEFLSTGTWAWDPNRNLAAQPA